MPDIFVSYAREDGEAARALSAAFEAQGWSTFFDRRIPPGQTWRSSIGRALSESRCVVVMWSKASLDSNWVHEEAEAGRERGVLVPVSLDGTVPPIGFRSIQSAMLESTRLHSGELEFAELKDAIATVLEATDRDSASSLGRVGTAGTPAKRGAAGRADSVASSGSRLRTGRTVAVAVAAAVIVSAMGSAWWLTRSPAGTPDKTTSMSRDSNSSQVPPAAGQRLTPVFGITPGATTRRDVQGMLAGQKFAALGAVTRQAPDRIEFGYGVLKFHHSGSDLTQNDFDTVVSLEYWGNQPLPLGFDTRMTLDQARAVAERHYVWLGTQSFRGLVYSTRKAGPILLEISWRSGRANPLTYTVYGPL